MVVLQTDEHDNTVKFNRYIFKVFLITFFRSILYIQIGISRNTLTSELLITFLRENNILVWAGDVRDPESFQGLFLIIKYIKILELFFFKILFY
jgi:hypothetical protein